MCLVTPYGDMDAIGLWVLILKMAGLLSAGSPCDENVFMMESNDRPTSIKKTQISTTADIHSYHETRKRHREHLPTCPGQVCNMS